MASSRTKLWLYNAWYKQSRKRSSNMISQTTLSGEKQDVGLEIYVDKKTAHSLNSGQDKLYDILVLHLMGGKDIFITVSGSYTRSCFGCSLDALVQLTVPIRELSPGQVYIVDFNMAHDTNPILLM